MLEQHLPGEPIVDGPGVTAGQVPVARRRRLLALLGAIPQEIREGLGLLPNTEVTFDIVDGEARLRNGSRGGELSRGDGVIRHLRGVKPSNKLGTDEIMALMRGKP